MKRIFSCIVINGMLLIGKINTNIIETTREVVKYCRKSTDILDCIGGAAYSLKDHVTISSTPSKEYFITSRCYSLKQLDLDFDSLKEKVLEYELKETKEIVIGNNQILLYV